MAEHSFTHDTLHAARVRPSLLTRDIDLYGWRNFTDLVVRGSARSERPVTSLDVELSVGGSGGRLQRALKVTGDRRVERRGDTWRLGDPSSFTEMPLRYDRAFGGTDERGEDRLGDPDERKFLAETLDPDEDSEMSRFSYPRNPAGSGYVVDEMSLDGLAWPNVEWADEWLRLAQTVKPLDRWGEHPMPAGFDWFHHAWWPRCGYLVDCPATHDGLIPEAERAMGLFERDYETRSIVERSAHGFANGAHPYLARNRWQGDEVLRVTHMNRDGGDLGVKLPDLRPTARIRLPGDAWLEVPASLDLILVEAEQSAVSLLWRASLVHGRPALAIDWEERTEHEVRW
ncbi:MAG: DUF2169 domain-containing protein [Polyangiales bacterium]